MDMPFLKLLSCFLLLTTFKLASSEVDAPAYYDHNCTIDKNFTSNSPYQYNLNTLLHSLYSLAAFNDSPPEFYNTNTTAGTDADAAYGEYMCRGDIPMEMCKNCVQDATSRIASECPNSKEAIIWYYQCLVRYSNRSFFSTLDTQPIYTQCGGDMFDNQRAGFNMLLANTLNDLVEATPKSVGVKNFETKNVSISSELKTLYTLAQCTPNLSSHDCRKCLDGALEQIKSECLGNNGGQIMNPSCNLRFETYRFYNNIKSKIVVSVPPTYPPTPEGNSSGNTGKGNEHSRTLKIAVSVAVVSIMLFCFGFYYWKRKNNKSYKAILKKNFGSEGATLESLQFSLTAIEAATDKFSAENRIGKGGFGEVYMGILPDGSKIAVKRLSEHSRQGLLEFKNEVLLIAKLQHRNLVALLGFCLKDQEKLLVYEYVPNKSLDYFLFEFGRPSWLDRNCSTTEANNAYLNDLSSLFDNLSFSLNITENKGFNRTIVGNKSHTFYGLFMCRGDVPLELCHECVNEGIQELNSTCSSSKEAIVWYDMCMLRYSNRSFFSTLDTQPIYTKCGGVMLDNQRAGFNMLLANTLNVLVSATPKSVGVKNFETKNVSSSSELKTLYTLAQCTPNLSSHDCRKCLDGALEQIKSECLGNNGGQVMNPSCNLRFETYRFYNNSKSKAAVSVPPTYPPTPEGNSSGNTVGSEGATLESLQFGLAAIEAATDKFSIENRIGKGGFGEVYMGILPDGSKIAVKRLSEHSSQGLLEFKNEVLLIAKLQHRNLVALLGFCLKDQEKLLVYEYVPNKSLDYFLFGAQKQRVLNWQERYKITGGIARGILYLHEHSRLKVIHRDLKPSNILLDDEMNPKISDFGMARMVGINETRGNTNRIVGTLGYMAPEYIKFGLFSDKSDVFSFGVIVLEIVSGKSINFQGESHESQYSGGLLHDTWKHWRDKNLAEILDSNLTEAYGLYSEIIKCIHIGLLCVQGNPQVRPSMNEVVQYLSNDSMELPVPKEPAFFMQPQMETSRAMEAQRANHNQYSINEISNSTVSPR